MLTIFSLDATMVSPGMMGMKLSEFRGGHRRQTTI